jgi:hypothetical protein
MSWDQAEYNVLRNISVSQERIADAMDRIADALEILATDKVILYKKAQTDEQWLPDNIERWAAKLMANKRPST